MAEIKRNSLWMVRFDMPANRADVGKGRAEEQERVTIKKGEIIEFRYHYGIHFRTAENRYYYVTEKVLLKCCEPFGQVLEKIAWENKTNLDEILRAKLYTSVHAHAEAMIQMKHLGTGIKSLKIKAGKLLCKLGFHNWSENHCGVRVCRRCPAVDRHYGLSGYIRLLQERRFNLSESDAELRAWWELEAEEGKVKHE